MAKTETALVPQRERTVDFYGDAIPVVQTDDGAPYVALRPIVDYLGLYFSAQRRRVLRDEVMTERLRTILVTASDGRQRAQLCLPLDLLPGFLFGITPSQAKPEIMEKLKRYRADCFRVLWQAFAGDASSVAAATVGAQTSSDRALDVVEQMGLAIVQLAREQRAMEHRVDSRMIALEGQVTARQRETTERLDQAMSRLDQAAAVVGTLMRRMDTVEGMVSQGDTISEAQAAEISALVRAIAGELAARGAGKNPYQSVFGALYHEFRVASYRQIPAGKFTAVMRWLREYQETLDAHGDADD